LLERPLTRLPACALHRHRGSSQGGTTVEEREDGVWPVTVQTFVLTEAQTAYVQQHAELQQLPTAEPDRPQPSDR